MRGYAETCRRARSSDPVIAFPALQRLGRAYPITPTTDTGHKLYGPGRLCLPAATCISADPQCRAATFWGTDTANTTITPNQALPVSLPTEPTLTTCLKLVNDGTADAPVTANLTVLASTVHNCSLYVFAPIHGGNFTITVENGHTFSLAALSGANSDWVRYAVQANTVGGEVVLGLKFTFAGGTASTVYVTGFNPIASAVLTPYGDGTYPGWAWSGPAFGSTSTRTASDLSWLASVVPLGATGTVALRYVPLWAGTDATTRCLFGAGTSGSNRLVAVKGADSKIAFYCGASFAKMASAESFAVGTTHTFVGRYTTSDQDVNHDGIDAPQSTVDATYDGGGVFKLGEYSYVGSTESYVYIGPVIISPARAADAYGATQQANSGALYADVMGMVELARRYSLQPFLTLPLQQDSVGWVVTE